MSFIKNPFRKTAPVKAQNKSPNPAVTNNRIQSTKPGAKPGTDKSGLPKNYLDPNSVF
ncbi:MAG: hypothetical protein PVJ39_06450 [Gammaproteobacteria bacterium]|jgi:hypothetical protein